MSEGEMFTDEDLVVFLDGAADADLHARIARALETDAALAERLAELDIPMDALQAGFAALAEAAPPPPPVALAPAAAPPARGRFGLWAAAAAVLLAFGLGGVGGYQYRGAPPEPGWMAVAANYQALYTRDTLQSPSPDAAERTAALKAMSEVLGRDIAAAETVDGLTFKRAQVLGFKGRPLIQIAYVNEAGEPFALCIIEMKNVADQPTKVQAFNGLSAAHWKKDGFGFLLIGGGDNEAVQTWAQGLQTEI